MVSTSKHIYLFSNCVFYCRHRISYSYNSFCRHIGADFNGWFLTGCCVKTNNVAKSLRLNYSNVVLLCKVPVDKRCVLSWTVCDYLCWPYCAVFALIFNPCYRSYDVIRVVFDLRSQYILCHIEPGPQNPTHGPREPRSGNTPLFPTTWHMITPDKIRSWPNRPCPINQSESILINQWKSRISDQSGHRIPHQLNLIGY